MMTKRHPVNFFHLSDIYFADQKGIFDDIWNKNVNFYSFLLPTGGLGESQRGTQETKLSH